MYKQDSGIADIPSAGTVTRERPESLQQGDPGTFSRRNRAIAGLRDMTPFLVSGIPLGLIGGAYGVTSGLDFWKTLLLAMAANSGTVQFVATKLIHDGAAAITILITSLILSLRLVFYAMILRSRIRPLSSGWQVLLGFGLIDAVFFTVTKWLERPENEENWHWYYLGASGAMYVTWMGATVVGMLLGSSIPQDLTAGLDFPMTALFAAMLGATLAGWRVCAAVSVAGAIAAMAAGLPNGLGVIAATISGGATGALCDLIAKALARARVKGI